MDPAVCMSTERIDGVCFTIMLGCGLPFLCIQDVFKVGTAVDMMMDAIFYSRYDEFGIPMENSFADDAQLISDVAWFIGSDLPDPFPDFVLLLLLHPGEHKQ